MLSVDPEVWRQLLEHIADLRADRVERMARGGCATWEEYRHEAGYVQALDDVVRAGQDVVGRMSGIPLEDEEEE